MALSADFMDTGLDGTEEYLGSQSEEDACLLCKKKIKDSEFPKIVDKALQRKYCSNLNNYFYLKDINRLIGRER